MLEISVHRSAGKVRIKVPFNEEIAAAFEHLKGVPREGEWVFDEKLFPKIKSALEDVFGWDGITDTDLSDLLITFGEDEAYGGSLMVGGRTMLRRASHNKPVIVSPDCTVVQGDFAKKGGSEKHPEIGAVGGVAIQVHDLPETLAKALEEGWNDPETGSSAGVVHTGRRVVKGELVVPTPATPQVVFNPALAFSRPEGLLEAPKSIVSDYINGMSLSLATFLASKGVALDEDNLSEFSEEFLMQHPVFDEMFTLGAKSMKMRPKKPGVMR